MPGKGPPKFEDGEQATTEELQGVNIGSDGELRPTFISENMSLKGK